MSREVMMQASEFLAQRFGVATDHELADGLERLSAIHPLASFIVQAPAGSGKTSLLAQRFLVLLSQVEAPEQIVAVTFTKKAAAEMRERVFKLLNAALQPLGPQAKLVERNNWLLAQKALQRDAEMGWNLLDNPNRLRIKTIDGLNGYLVGQMPLLSKMGTQSSIAQTPDKVYREAVRAVLKSPLAEESVATLLQLVNGRYNRAEVLLMSMLAKRDQWMASLLPYGHEETALEARTHLETALQEIIIQELQGHLRVLSAQYPLFAEICEIAAYAQGNDQPQLQTIASAWPLSEEADGIVQWRILADWILTKDSKGFRKRLTKNEGFPSGKGEAKQRKDEMSEILKALDEADGLQGRLRESLAVLKSLPQPHYSDDQWQNLQALLQLLKLSAAHLKLVFQAHGEADFIEIAQAALQALGDDESPTDLAQQLDYQIQHLLVDEFQDTSREQFRLLEKLLAGWQRDDGRSVFLVGDPMQSIYRFREAEVGNFLKAWQGEIGGVPLIPLKLQVNFRSSGGVVDWVNRHFKQIFPNESLIEKGAVAYSDSQAFSDDFSAAVQTHWALNRSARQEVLDIVEVIDKALNDQRDIKAQIAVLGRSRSHLMPLAVELKTRGIPFRAVELEALSERQEIQDVLALSRALLHLGDRAAWIALLRTPMIGFSLVELDNLIAAKPYKTVWSLWQAQSNDSDWQKARWRHAFTVLENALQQLGRLPFSQLVRETWLLLQGALTVENDLAVENVEAFCRALSAHDQETLDGNGLQQITDVLYAEADASEASSAIELMTMHKSKGLEFDTVILPSLGRKPRGDESSLISWFQFLSEEGEERLVFAPLDPKGTDASYLSQLLRGFEKQKQRYELARLLYVACTRAKRHLHLFGQVDFALQFDREDRMKVPKPQPDSLLDVMWPEVGKAFQTLADTHDEAGNEILETEAVLPKVSRLDERESCSLEIVKNMERQAFAWQVEQTPSESEAFDAKRFDAGGKGAFGEEAQSALLNTAVGNLVHRLLELRVEQGVENWTPVSIETAMPLYRRWLAQQGLKDQLLSSAEQRVQRCLLNACNNDHLRQALDSSLAESATELALSSLEADQAVRNHIIDRTFVDESGVRWIVDYKTSVYEGEDLPAFLQGKVFEYQPQLQRYGELFKQIEQRPQKWVLYFAYVDQWLEVTQELMEEVVSE
ncbi:UvrD-helicase domain-containing protein [Thiomicrorhabdus heinhorstiae]|uniref:DNA 3'-5' helicase n=1 Tax=Thiomicrorhabdus heinhorstiae TaxID=2748010 RepID=A0ABS0BZE0_9GAMM|nr:UvrD-helicase domain-containing protein [Thiomicrorhabdus heinhorstiae]MBF6058400.1 UvrD-helicase domain-containing protein [Thiomicrorhabdus heinhorstiae]